MASKKNLEQFFLPDNNKSKMITHIVPKNTYFNIHPTRNIV